MKFWLKMFTVMVSLLFMVIIVFHFHANQTYSKSLIMEEGQKLTVSAASVSHNQLLNFHEKHETNRECTDSDMFCLSLLSDDEFAAYKYCESYVQNVSVPGVTALGIEAPCSFRNGTGYKTVALVSETGSGNTWVRGLLEKATGVCTGAIYCDPALRNSGMVGEFVIGSSVLVVKTHTPDYQWEGVAHPGRESDPEHQDGYYGSAILLIRNPFDAFVSEWNRFITIQKRTKSSKLKAVGGSLADQSHTFSLGEEMFGSNREWNSFLSSICKRWYNVYTRWFSSAVTHQIPVLVVHYEKIQQNKVLQVENMLKFLKFKYDHSTIVEKFKEDFEVFHRNHSTHFKHYTVRQTKLVNNCIRKAAQYLKHYDVSNVFELDSYLRE